MADESWTLGPGTPRMSREALDQMVEDEAMDSFVSLGPPHTDTRCPACEGIVEDTLKEKRSHLTQCVGEPSIMALAREEVADA